MTARQRQLRLNILAFLLLFSVSLYRQLSLRYLPDDVFRTYILYACYVLLIGAWIVSINARITQKSMRLFLTLEAVVMLIGLSIRFLQDTFWYDNKPLMRVSGMYIESTLLVGLTFGIFASLGIGQWDNYRPPRKWLLLLIPVIAMTFLSVTDESRHFMFYMGHSPSVVGNRGRMFFQHIENIAVLCYNAVTKCAKGAVTWRARIA